jgi:N-acyl-D-aspartate/D-glutamate deacylase
VCLCALGGAADLAAQDLAITNARIVDGDGTAIARGSIVVRNGRIAFVSPGAATPRRSTGSR